MERGRKRGKRIGRLEGEGRERERGSISRLLQRGEMKE